MYKLPPSLVFQINVLEADHVVEVGEEAVDVQVVVLVHLVVEERRLHPSQDFLPAHLLRRDLENLENLARTSPH